MLARRVWAAARPGQILMSHVTESVLEPSDVPGLRIRDVGERRVKDFDRPAHLYEVVTPPEAGSAAELRTDPPI